MDDILEYVRARSPQGAVTVEEDIFRMFEFLESMPEGAPAEENAPTFPQASARGRRAIAGNYEILYAYPVLYEGDPATVAILMVRDTRRKVIDRAEIRQRFIDLMLLALAPDDAPEEPPAS